MKVDLEHCKNGAITAPQKCDYTNPEPDPWITGALTGNNAHYFEGESVPNRAVFEGLSTRAAGDRNLYTVALAYDTTKNGKHAFDFLTSYNFSEANADPCSAGTNQGDATIAGCDLATATQMAIPADPHVTAAGVPQGDGATPGQMTLFGGTIVSISTPTRSGPYSGTSSTSITVQFRATSTNPVLAWGAHLSKRSDWGGPASVDINGSPYHVNLPAFSGGNDGRRDLPVNASAVIYPGSLTVIKDAQPDSAKAFTFQTTGAGLSDFTLVDDGVAGAPSHREAFDKIGVFGSKTVTESTQSGWKLKSLSCTGTSSKSVDTTTRTATLDIQEGEANECTFVNERETGTLRVIKAVTNDDGGLLKPDAFQLHVKDGGADVAQSPAPGDAAGKVYTLPTGTYDLSEAAVRGYQRTGFSGSCTENAGTGTASVTVVVGTEVTCTITNDDVAPKLIVTKTVVGGSAGSGDFTMNVANAAPSIASFRGDATGTPVTLKAGAYSVDESAAGPSGYSKSRSAGCDGTAVIGETSTCTITNTRDQGKLEIRKNLLPATDAGRFDLQIDGKADPGNEGQNVGDGGTTGEETLDTGTYSVREVAAAGTSLAGYVSEIDCKDAAGTTVASAAGAGPLNVTVGKDDDIVCAVTNTRLGRIEVEERVVGDSTASFSFATVSPAGGTPLGGTFSLTDGQTTASTPGLPAEVLPNSGAYEITQAAKTGFRLTGLACADATGDTVASQSARTASVKVAPGETVKCTFTNEKVDAQPILVKAGNIDAFHGDQLTFTFTVSNTGNGPISNVTLTDDKCSNVTGPTRSGGNADALLDPRETWVYACTMTAPEHSAGEANPLVNVATVAGEDEFGRGLTSEDRHETRFLHPAIAVDKDGPAEADAGAEATFTYAVTNPGDTPLDGITLTDDKCSAVTGPVKESGDQDDRLSSGERWVYGCTLTLPDEGDSLVNTATASGTARTADEPVQRRAAAVRTLSGTDVHTTRLRFPTATATPTPTPAPVQISGEPVTPLPAAQQQVKSQVVASPRARRGKAKLQSPTGCRSSAFRARVSGQEIRTVTFTVDGKQVARLSRANASGAYVYAIRPGAHGYGTHRLAARVQFTKASRTKAKTLRRTFLRCARPAARPQFTG